MALYHYNNDENDKYQKQPPEVFCKKRPATLLEKDSGKGVFPLNFAKFLTTPFLQNTSGGLLLKYLNSNFVVI